MNKIRLAIYKSFCKYNVTTLDNYLSNVMDGRKVILLDKDLQESLIIVINAWNRDLKDDESVAIHLMSGLECEAIWTVTNKGVFAAIMKVIK